MDKTFILFGSGNAHKYTECKAILEDIPLASLEECNIQGNAQECGTTFFKNAFLKALHYYEAMQNTCKNRMKAVLVEDSGISVQTTWQGSIIATPPQGTQGFGYDPVFFVPTHGCTSAELETQEKNAISHRGRALRALLPHVKTILNNVY